MKANKQQFNSKLQGQKQKKTKFFEEKKQV